MCGATDAELVRRRELPSPDRYPVPYTCILLDGLNGVTDLPGEDGESSAAASSTSYNFLYIALLATLTTT